MTGILGTMRFLAVWIAGLAVAFWGVAATGAEASPTGAGGLAAAGDPRMEWFGRAKLGIFIHWGLYSVRGIDESWSFYNGYISHEDYMKQAKGFGAAAYRPDAWAELISRSGARYAVLTAKHHDGFALWDSALGEWSAKNQSPARRDLVGPFCRALRQRGIKVGLYYSLIDWTHPDYPVLSKSVRRYDPAEDPVRWNRFATYNTGQLKELSERYNPDLYWFDGDWEQNAERWGAAAVREMLLARNGAAIMNSRLSGYGDYETPEQGVPITPPAAPYWELCLTMNDSWGYQPRDRHYKSAGQLLRIFADCISMGGNLLLDIGPDADGNIPPEQTAILQEFGRWTRKHEAAIYETGAGLPAGHFHGPTALSRDQTILYLFQEHTPNGPLAVKGLKNRVLRAWVVGSGAKIACEVFGKQYWSDVPGILYIHLPPELLDPQITVIALLLEGKAEVYRGTGHHTGTD